MKRASCICGAVQVTVDAPLAAPSVCHCVQCRKGSGHVTVSTHAPREAVHIAGEVRWYAYKPGVRRGFCPVFGSQIGWDRDGDPTLSIEMGLFDDPTGVRIAGHMFTAEKGDYYEIDDGLPRREGP